MSRTPSTADHPPASATRQCVPSHRVAMLVYPDAQILDIAGPLEVFARSARWLCEHRGLVQPAYAVQLLAASPGPVRTSGGLELLAGHGYRDAPPVDTLLVSGGIGFPAACRDRALLDWLRERETQVARIGSICTGSLILAAAGLLDGREATTHWRFLDRLAEYAPGCRVLSDVLFVESGKVYTSAGVTAGIDLALALVENDWGRSTAVEVAEELVLYRRRRADERQSSRFLEAERRDDRFGQLELWILDHLDQPLPVERLAEQARMSPRNFARRFRQAMGSTPADFVARLRVEEAQRRLDAGSGSLKDVARHCGFGDEQSMRRAFRRILGLLPGERRPQAPRPA